MRQKVERVAPSDKVGDSKTFAAGGIVEIRDVMQGQILPNRLSSPTM